MRKPLLVGHFYIKVYEVENKITKLNKNLR